MKKYFLLIKNIELWDIFHIMLNFLTFFRLFHNRKKNKKLDWNVQILNDILVYYFPLNMNLLILDYWINSWTQLFRTKLVRHLFCQNMQNGKRLSAASLAGQHLQFCDWANSGEIFTMLIIRQYMITDLTRVKLSCTLWIAGKISDTSL